MKKTYRQSRRSRKNRMTKKYTLRRLHKSHRAHKSHRIQRGGNYNYELDTSTTSDVIFVTRKTRPRMIYRIDLPSRTFSIFTSSEPYETYPLEKIYDRTLFKILSNAKRNDDELDKLLVSHGINNIEYYPDDEHIVRDRKKTYKHVLRKIEEIKASPRSKTFKNKSLSHSTKKGLREAMKLAEVITDDKIERLRS